MAIVLQNAGKQGFFVISGGNQRKNLRSFTTFMQNKPNFQKSQMNVNLCLKKNYENKRDWTIGQSKPNSKPIKPNLPKAKMNVNSILTKDYRKKMISQSRKTNPIQTQYKPNQTQF